jgi:HD superfamily phosphohydrolase
MSSRQVLFRDEIHGDMAFSPLITSIIDHRFFQRLRHIKQLGLAEHIFPCATHTRFQHSLGACFLSSKYFDSLFENYKTAPTHDELLDKNILHTIETIQSNEKQYTFWKNVVAIAALLHDVGHGPLSHTFEFLDFKFSMDKEISKLPKNIQDHFKTLNHCYKHEEFSLIYLYKMIEELDVEDKDNLFQCVAGLINKKITPVSNFHTLLRPLISGPFDVDRMDYIQRDSRNCGVHIGGIEWQRIVSKVTPLLDKKGNSVLVSNVKNQHILDDFIFSLFQMYTQVYLHPKIVGLEELVKKELKSHPKIASWELNFDTYSELTDEVFTTKLVKEFNIKKIGQLLNREIKFDLAYHPQNKQQEKTLTENGYENIVIQNRAMMKDFIQVYLWSSLKNKKQEEEIIFMNPWLEVSPLALQFFNIQYSPNVWIRSLS